MGKVLRGFTQELTSLVTNFGSLEGPALSQLPHWMGVWLAYPKINALQGFHTVPDANNIL
eukprot:1145262-Pelagomonas_calceolata.AAC.6